MTDKMTKELNKFVDFVCQNRHKIVIIFMC